ncbi:MAG: carboxypeptidase-like regulatory domain-containing protein, partial [Vicinamibacteria bacterium]
MTAHLASAQSGTATQQGKVIDAQKMALPGANVTLANPATGFTRTVQSDTSGAFAFPSVPPGTYALTVEMQGFKTSVVDKVALQV